METAKIFGLRVVSWKLVVAGLLFRLKNSKSERQLMTVIAAIHSRLFERTEIVILYTIGLIKNTLGEK